MSEYLYWKIIEDRITDEVNTVLPEDRKLVKRDGCGYGSRLLAEQAPETILEFRLLDDDGDVYYIGEVLDTEISMISVLRYGAEDSGACVLETRAEAGEPWTEMIS